MRLLQPCHVEGWRKGNEHYRVLQPWIQVGPEKFQKTIRHFQEWVKQRGLRPIEAAHTRRGPGGIEQLHVTEDSDPQWEKFYRTYYTPPDLPEKKTARLAAKLNRPPELVVFEKVGDEGKCHESGAELLTRDYLLMDNCQPLLSHLRRPGPIGVSPRRRHRIIAAVTQAQFTRGSCGAIQPKTQTIRAARSAGDRGSLGQSIPSPISRVCRTELVVPPKAILEFRRILLKSL